VRKARLRYCFWRGDARWSASREPGLRPAYSLDEAISERVESWHRVAAISDVIAPTCGPLLGAGFELKIGGSAALRSNPIYGEAIQIFEWLKSFSKFLERPAYPARGVVEFSRSDSIQYGPEGWPDFLSFAARYLYK
jgi:hypothetical protein